MQRMDVSQQTAFECASTSSPPRLSMPHVSGSHLADAGHEFTLQGHAVLAQRCDCLRLDRAMGGNGDVRTRARSGSSQLGVPRDSGHRRLGHDVCKSSIRAVMKPSSLTSGVTFVLILSTISKATGAPEDLITCMAAEVSSGPILQTTSDMITMVSRDALAPPAIQPLTTDGATWC